MIAPAGGRNKGRELDPRLFFTFSSQGPCCGGMVPAATEGEPDRAKLDEMEPHPAGIYRTKESVPQYKMEPIGTEMDSKMRHRALEGTINVGFTDPTVTRNVETGELVLSFRF